MVRTKRTFYATNKEYEEFVLYAQSKERTLSQFARYAMKAEISKRQYRVKNRPKK